MASNIINTGSEARYLQPGLNKTFGAEYKAWDEKWRKIVEFETSKKSFEYDQQWDSFSLAPVKPEGAQIAYDGLIQGMTPKYQHQTYAKGFIVTEEALEDNLYGLFAKKPRMLARSMQLTKEYSVANLFNFGFDSSYTMPGGDGQPLFSSNHTLGPSDPSTYSNQLSTPAAFSEASLEQMLIEIYNQEDSRGLRFDCRPMLLFGPNELTFEFERVVKSVLQNDTSNNAVNAVNSMGALKDGFMVNPYLIGSTTAWFIKTDVMDGPKLISRQDVRFEQDNDFGTSNYRFKAYARWSTGWSDARGCFGSAGTGS